MGNELQSLDQLFQNKLFRIPDYQRGYAWQRSQLVDFWEDLLNLQDYRYHYTGMLSLKTLKRADIENWGSDLWMLDKGFKPCHIVDGQQRITINNYNLHPTQKLKSNPDGTTTVTFEAGGKYEICWHLFRWGKDVEILEPQVLKDTYKKLLDESLQQFVK